MRFAILPLIGLGNPTQDSNFHVWSDFIKELAPQGHFFYMVVGNDNFPELPNTTYLTIDEPIDFFYRSCHAPEIMQRFSIRHGDIIVDAVLTSRAGISHYLQATLSDFRTKNEMPVVVLEPLVRHDGVANPAVRRAMAYSTVNSMMWFLNADERKKAIENARTYASSSDTLSAIDNGIIEGLWVNTDYINEVTKNITKNEKFTVLWAGRISPDKQPEKMVEIMEKFYSFGRDVRQIVTTHQENPHLAKIVTNASSIEQVIFSCKRDEFLQKTATAHMFICTSKVEGFPTGFWEQLYVVQIGIFPDKPWVRASLPSNYPFIYKDMMEAHVLIRWIMDNYDEALKKVDWIREYIKETVDRGPVCNRMMDKIITYATMTKIEPGVKMLEETYQDTINLLPDRFTLAEYEKALEKTSKSYSAKRVPVLGYPSKHALYRFLKTKLTDDCTQSTPTLE
jgi:hypothetical protein